jgi:hypothetical protein
MYSWLYCARTRRIVKRASIDGRLATARVGHEHALRQLVRIDAGDWVILRPALVRAVTSTSTLHPTSVETARLAIAPAGDARPLDARESGSLDARSGIVGLQF